MKPRTRAWLIVGLLYAGLAGSLTSFHAFQVNFGPRLGFRTERHRNIVNFEEGKKPWAYRVLVPLAVEHPVEDVLQSAGLEKPNSREYAYLVVRFSSTWLTLLLTHLLIARFASPSMALAGGLLVAALHGPSIEHYWFQPASGPDHVLWLAAALLTLSGKDRWLFPLVFFGAFNRETIVFVVPIHLALRWRREPLQRTLLRSAVLMLLWAVPFMMLRELIVLSPKRTRTAAKYFMKNLTDPEWQWYAVTFSGVWIGVTAAGWRHVPRPLKRLIGVMLPYLALILAFGRIREVRLLLPATVAFVPAAMVVMERWLAELSSEPPPADRARHPGPPTG